MLNFFKRFLELYGPCLLAAKELALETCKKAAVRYHEAFMGLASRGGQLSYIPLALHFVYQRDKGNVRACDTFLDRSL